VNPVEFKRGRDGARAVSTTTGREVSWRERPFNYREMPRRGSFQASFPHPWKPRGRWRNDAGEAMPAVSGPRARDAASVPTMQAMTVNRVISWLVPACRAFMTRPVTRVMFFMPAGRQFLWKHVPGNHAIILQAYLARTRGMTGVKSRPYSALPAKPCV
jgi:hypothetical protein